MTTPISGQLTGFLRTVAFPVIVGTKRANGSVQLNPAWYEMMEPRQRDGLAPLDSPG